MSSWIEIERRFLVDGRYERPWRDCLENFHIRQLYLDKDKLTTNSDTTGIVYDSVVLVTEIDPSAFSDIAENSDWVVRIRKKGIQCYLTLKGKRVGASAKEHEFLISDEVFEKVVSAKQYPEITKTRYNWRGEDGKIWEVDEFEGLLGGLVIAEVELSREDEDLALPDWLGLEITHLRNWSNADLARSIKSATDKMPKQ